jgi:hypothetical protein
MGPDEKIINKVADSEKTSPEISLAESLKR